MSRKQDESDRPHEPERLDMSQLGAMLRERRGKLSLRQAAQESGVSFSTFSRVEAGSQPDLTSFTLLCGWLGVAPAHFFAPSARREIEPVEEAIAHLSSDPRLEPEAAQKIADVLRGMYSALARDRVETPVFACHLRATSVMRPGVPDRLNALLTQMYSSLERKVAAREL
jgi:transcriptional regulator with XRE-family HTH domain